MQVAGVLERMDMSAVPLLGGMIVVIAAPNFVIPRVVLKWAIFGPVFIPILHPLWGSSRRWCSPPAARSRLAEEVLIAGRHRRADASIRR
jgi:hypothetical protein